MTTSTEIKKAIAKVLNVNIKYVGVKKNKDSFNAGVRNQFFVDAQNDSSINQSWNNLSNSEYLNIKLQQAEKLENELQMLVSPTANKANFDFYVCKK